MIFAPVIAERVLAGKVTETRRPIAPDRGCSVRKGHHYAVQKGRSAPGVGHVRILGVDRDDLGRVTLKDALAMGYRSRDEFFEDWARMYADRAACAWPQLVWVIKFELVRVLPAPDPMWLARGPRGLTPRRAAAIDREVPAEDLSAGQHLLSPGGGPTNGVPLAPDRSGGSRPVSREDVTRFPLAQQEARSLRAEIEDRLDAILLRTRGEEPEDAARLYPVLGSAGDVRDRRRRLGLRAVDGLEPLPDDEAERIRAYMLARPGGCSVRELARALDWSLGKAHAEISRYRRLPELYSTRRSEAA